MNTPSDSLATKSANLSDAIRELTGRSPELAGGLELGPGVVYVLELPSRSLRYIAKNGDAFPRSFFGLADSVDQWDELVAPADLDAYRASWASGEQLASCVAYSILSTRRGTTLPVQDYRSPLYSQNGQLVGAVGRIVDDSFRSMAMEALSRRSWKEVAAAITRRFLHDFNNTIAGIYSLSELYSEPGSDAQSMMEAMGHIRSSSTRAQNLTRKIRQLTTFEDGDHNYFNLETLVEDQKEYLAALLPKGAALSFALSGQELPVHLDGNRFRQALLHLARNASDAAGSEVAVSINVIGPNDSGAPGLARVDFQDNGPGIKPSLREQIFEPFFTTKDSARHPGLGLHIVKSFIESLGGRARAASSDSGATISLFIPLVSQNGPTSGPAAPAAAAPRTTAAVAAPRSSQAARSALIYSWEDVSRHPLLQALRDGGWSHRSHLDTTDFLLDLAQSRGDLSGLIFFKSALDEKAEPLLYELGRARDCPPIAVVLMGESVEAMPERLKSHCGLIISGASKPSALMNKLSKLFA